MYQWLIIMIIEQFHGVSIKGDDRVRLYSFCSDADGSAVAARLHGNSDSPTGRSLRATNNGADGRRDNELTLSQCSYINNKHMEDQHWQTESVIYVHINNISQEQKSNTEMINLICMEDQV